MIYLEKFDKFYCADTKIKPQVKRTHTHTHTSMHVKLNLQARAKSILLERES
jgi:hypothetical protein